MFLSKTITERYNLFRKEIANKLFAGTDPGEIIKIREMGNTLHHGETVSLLDTAGGQSFYYKPHDGGSFELLGEVNKYLFGKKMIPNQVNGDTFIFQEKVERQSPKTEEEKVSFYTWMGRLTAVFYALGSIDMTVNNVFSCGELPFVIDTETLLCPKVNNNCGIWNVLPDYRDVFPDLHASIEECRVLPLLNYYIQMSPLLPGEGCTIEGYEDCFLSGFEEGYLKICKNREDIGRILDRYADIPLLYIFRPYKEYLSIQNACRYARTQEEKSAVLKRLENGLSRKGLVRLEKVLSRERFCLAAGNLPQFTVSAGNRDLRDGLNSDVLVSDYFECSPIREAERRMEKMGKEDLKVQTAYIRASLKHIDYWTFEGKKEGPFIENTVLSPNEALEEVREAVNRLWEERIPVPEGKMLWHVSLERSPVNSMFSFVEAISAAAIFAADCVKSVFIAEEEKEKAKEMASAAFRSVAAFGSCLLDRYPTSPDTALFPRRFKTILAELLWAIKKCRDEDPDTAARLLNGFKSWKLEDPEKAAIASLRRRYENTQTERLAETDILDGGNAGLAAIFLQEAQEESRRTESLKKAGRILCQMVKRKKESGSYHVFQRERKQYFRPGFLWGSTGIAWVLLRYAEQMEKTIKKGTEA